MMDLVLKPGQQQHRSRQAELDDGQRQILETR